MLDDLLFAYVPVEIARHHVVLDIFMVLLLLLVLDVEGLAVYCCEEVYSLFALKLDVGLWFWLDVFLFFVACMHFLFLSSVLLDLLNDLPLIKPEKVINLIIILITTFSLYQLT